MLKCSNKLEVLKHLKIVVYHFVTSQSLRPSVKLKAFAIWKSANSAEGSRNISPNPGSRLTNYR